MGGKHIVNANVIDVDKRMSVRDCGDDLLCAETYVGRATISRNRRGGEWARKFTTRIISKSYRKTESRTVESRHQENTYASNFPVDIAWEEVDQK